MSRVFKYNREEEARLKTTLKGQYVLLHMLEMDRRSNLPSRAWNTLRMDVSEANKVPYTQCNEYMTNVVDNVNKGKGLYIYGGVGTGKSSWSYKIVRRYITTLAYGLRPRPMAVYFANVPELLNNLKEGFSDPQYLKELTHSIQNSDLVVFDDIGAENSTEWAKEQLYHYINYRYSNEKATIFTANIPPNSLENRVADRIVGMTQVIELKGLSKRK